MTDKKFTIVYLVLLADEKGEFTWVCDNPKLLYYTREEAEQVRAELIKNDEYVNTKNSKVQRLVKIENKKSKE